MFDFLKPLLTKTATFAREAGIPLPLDNEIKSLNDKLKTIKGLSLRADDIKRLHIPRITARKTVNALEYARNLTTAISQAKAQGVAASKLINAAISEGRAFQEKIKFGTIIPKLSAAFALKKRVADDAYMKAKTRFDQAVASWQDMERRLAAEPTPMVKQVGQAFYQTGREAVAKTSRALVATGRAAQEAGASVGALSPYAKYIPYALGGFVVLYGISLLPRRQS